MASLLLSRSSILWSRLLEALIGVAGPLELIVDEESVSEVESSVDEDESEDDFLDGRGVVAEALGGLTARKEPISATWFSIRSNCERIARLSRF